jgi:hypothetical protein
MGQPSPARERVSTSIPSIKLAKRRAPSRSLGASNAHAGRPLRPERHVWVFLARDRLTAKTLGYEGWKSLDFLGFSRRNLAFSMGYTGFSPKENFARPFRPRGRGAAPASSFLTVRKRRITHGTSVSYFLISATKLPPNARHRRRRRGLPPPRARIATGIAAASQSTATAIALESRKNYLWRSRLTPLRSRPLGASITHCRWRLFRTGFAARPP